MTYLSLIPSLFFSVQFRSLSFQGAHEVRGKAVDVVSVSAYRFCTTHCFIFLMHAVLQVKACLEYDAGQWTLSWPSYRSDTASDLVLSFDLDPKLPISCFS